MQRILAVSSSLVALALGLANVAAAQPPPGPVPQPSAASAEPAPGHELAKKGKHKKPKKRKKSRFTSTSQVVPPPPLEPGSTTVGAAQMALGGNDERRAVVRTERNNAIVTKENAVGTFPNYATWTYTGQGNVLPCTDGVEQDNCRSQSDPWAGYKHPPAGNNSSPIQPADVDGNGRQDLAVINGGLLNVFYAGGPASAGTPGQGSFGLAGSEKAPWSLISGDRSIRRTSAVRVRPEGYSGNLRGGQIAAGRPDQAMVSQRVAVISDSGSGPSRLTVVGNREYETARAQLPKPHKAEMTVPVPPLAVTWADVDGRQGTNRATGQEVVTAVLHTDRCVQLQAWTYTSTFDSARVTKHGDATDVCTDFPVGSFQMTSGALAPGRGEQIALVLTRGGWGPESDPQLRIIGSRSAYDPSLPSELTDLTPAGLSTSGTIGRIGGGRFLAVSSPDSPGADTLLLFSVDTAQWRCTDDTFTDFCAKYEIRATRFVPQGWGRGGKSIDVKAHWGQRIAYWENKLDCDAFRCVKKVLHGDLSFDEIERLRSKYFLDASAADLNVDGWDEVAVILPDQNKRGRTAPWIMQSDGPVTDDKFTRDFPGSFPPEGGRDSLGHKPSIALFSPISNGMMVGAPQATFWHDSTSAQFLIDAPPTHADWLVADYGASRRDGGVGMTLVGEVPAADTGQSSTITVSNTLVPDFGESGRKFYPRLGTTREAAKPTDNPVMEIIRVGGEYMRITKMSQPSPHDGPVELQVERNVPGPDGVAPLLRSGPVHAAGTHVEVEYPANINFTSFGSICYGQSGGAQIGPCPASTADWKSTTSDAGTSSIEKKSGHSWGSSLEFSAALITGWSGKIGVTHKGARTNVDTDKTSKKVTLSTAFTVSKDDLMLATYTPTWIFKYPAWLPGNNPGISPADSYISMAVPVSAPKPATTGSKNLGQMLTSTHEVGNLLSYPPPYSDITQAPGFGTQTCEGGDGDKNGQCSATWVTSSTAAGYNARMTWENSKDKTVKNTTQMDIGGYLEGSKSFPPFADLNRAAGAKWTLKGDYNYSQGTENITSTTVSQSTELGVNVPVTGDGYDYSIQPLMYWTDRGTLRLTYGVDLLNRAGVWWRGTYNRPDYAFVRPWHMQTDMIGQFGFLRGRTTGMWADRVLQNGKPTGGAEVTALLKNYSTVPAPGTVVTFYANRPMTGPVIATANAQGMTIPAQGQAFVTAEVDPQFRGKCLPVYAVADTTPGELRTDNNISYSWLSIPDTNGASPGCDPDRNPRDVQAGPAVGASTRMVRPSFASAKVLRGPKAHTVTVRVRLHNKSKVALQTPVIVNAVRPGRPPVIVQGENSVAVKAGGRRTRTYDIPSAEWPRKATKLKVVLANDSPVRGRNKLVWKHRLTAKQRKILGVK